VFHCLHYLDLFEDLTAVLYSGECTYIFVSVSDTLGSKNKRKNTPRVSVDSVLYTTTIGVLTSTLASFSSSLGLACYQMIISGVLLYFITICFASTVWATRQKLETREQLKIGSYFS
jgi:hypothetical protein